MYRAKLHQPVLLLPSVEALNLQIGDCAIDATMGLGGHTQLIAQRVGLGGRILAIERDFQGLKSARVRLEDYSHQIVFVNGDFRDLEFFANIYDFGQVQGVLFDLGLASWQIDQGFLGLSFKINAPIDMLLTRPRCVTHEYDWTQNQFLGKTIRRWRFEPAFEFLNHASQEELALIFYELGDVVNSRKIARNIASQRIRHPIATTFDLKSVVDSNNPKKLAPIFQALRVLVNDEYGALMSGIWAAWNQLKVGGTLAIITFQSDEDRLVKNIFKQLPKTGIIKKEKPDEVEIKANPRSRSATLRTVAKA